MADVERRRAVEQLCRTLLDYLPTPNRDSTAPRSASEPGPAPGRRARCQRCDTTGRVNGQHACQACRAMKAKADQAGARWTAFGQQATMHGCQLCLACDGAGYVLAARGDERVDEMLTQGRTDQHDQAYERAEKRRRLDQEITRLEQLEHVREDDEAADWWLAAADRHRRAMWRSTSHGELWRLLQHLQAVMPFRYSVLMRTLVYEQEIVLSDRAKERLDETLDWIAERMPAVIRVPAPEGPTGQARQAIARQHTGPAARLRQERDDEIRRAVLTDGLSLREAAARFELGKSRVAEIVAEAGTVASRATGMSA